MCIKKKYARFVRISGTHSVTNIAFYCNYFTFSTNISNTFLVVEVVKLVMCIVLAQKSHAIAKFNSQSF